MTEREKIINIVEQNKYCDVNTAANCRECKYSKELENYKDMGCSSLKTADALIAAGIGDVSRRSQRYKKKIKRLKATMVQNEEAAREIIFQRTKRAEAAEHRAEVYERALYHTAISDTEYQDAIEQAQKEIAEGKKQ